MNECTKLDKVVWCCELRDGKYCHLSEIAQRCRSKADATKVERPPILPVLALDGDPCTLAACRPGFFLYEAPGEKLDLYLKVEAGGVGEFTAIYCSTGAHLYGGPLRQDETEALIVQPVRIVASKK